MRIKGRPFTAPATPKKKKEKRSPLMGITTREDIRCPTCKVESGPCVVAGPVSGETYHPTDLVVGAPMGGFHDTRMRMARRRRNELREQEQQDSATL